MICLSCDISPNLKYQIHHNILNGRSSRIRTYDPLVPNQVHYQAVLCSEIGVNDGIRTRDNWNHNPGLYQLSYIHHKI